MAECTCDQCGVSFRPHRPGRTQRFCANECRFAWMRTGATRRTRFDRPCAVCAKLFRPANPDSKFCSTACVRAGKLSLRPSFSCECCGGVISVPPSRVQPRFCSWACRVESGDHGFQTAPSVSIQYVDCDQCGKLFVRRAKRDRRYAHAFCGMGCRDSYYGSGALRDQDTWQTVECGWCGTTFEGRKIRIAAGHDKFCSKPCAGHGRKINGSPSAIATAAVDEWCARRDRPLHVREMRIGRWSLDVALPLDLIAIELDGVYWHSLPAMVDRDRRKDAYLLDAGWRVLRIPIGKGATPEGLADDMDAGLHKLRRSR